MAARLLDVPIYSLIEQLKYHDLINLALSCRYFIREIYFRAKPIVKLNSPRYAERIIRFFKNARLKISDFRLFTDSEIRALRGNVVDMDLRSFVKSFPSIKLDEFKEVRSLFVEKVDLEVIPSTVTELCISDLKVRGEIKSVLFTDLLDLEIWADGAITDNVLGLLTKLTRLQIMNETGITDGSLSKLVNLREFILNTLSEGITDAGVVCLTKLTSLRLEGQRYITDNIFGYLPNLVELLISGKTNTSEIGIGRLKNLKTLWIYTEMKFSDSVMKQMTSLTELQIGSVKKLTSEGLLGLTNMVRLAVGKNKIDNRGVVNMIDLRALNLYNNVKITDDGLSNKLTELRIESNDVISDVGLSRLTRLKKLVLSFNRKITDVGLASLRDTLEFLDLSDENLITDVGLKALTKLTFLNLMGNGRITDVGVSALVNLRCVELGMGGVGSVNVTFECLIRLKNIRKIRGIHRVAGIDDRKKRMLADRGIIIRL